MREIKFRAWNKETGKMMQWSDIQRFGNLNKLLRLNHVVVMQFTGFYDKHGKEIYEGDVIMDHAERDDKEQVFWNDKTGCWDLDISYNQDKSTSGELYRDLKDFLYEVVGNIYEKS